MVTLIMSRFLTINPLYSFSEKNIVLDMYIRIFTVNIFKIM